METFHSLQGEGIHVGRSAFFIRLAGCSVGCSWCDTKASWPAAAHPLLSPEQLLDQTRQAAGAGAGFVVITGGEPLHHNLNELCQRLRHSQLPLHLETSGVDPLSGSFDWITLAPKGHRQPLPELLRACNELKVVVHSPADLELAEAMAAAAQADRAAAQPLHLLLQPGWNCAAGQELAINHVRSNAQWRLSLQTHKWLGVP